MSSALTTISMTIHAIISLTAIGFNFYLLRPWNSILFRKRREYFLLFIVIVVNLTKCILPADVSIEYLIGIMKTSDSNMNSYSLSTLTRMTCVGDFRASTLTTVYFFHGFLLAWIAIERLLTVRNPLRSATNVRKHIAVISGFAVLASGIYLACFIDAKIHDPEPGAPNCALAGTLGNRLKYPVMSIRIFALVVGFVCYPFIIYWLLNLKRWHLQQTVKSKRQQQTYKISVTICIILTLDIIVEAGPDIVVWFSLVPLEYFTFVQNIYLSRSLAEPIIFFLRHPEMHRKSNKLSFDNSNNRISTTNNHRTKLGLQKWKNNNVSIK